MGSISTVIHFKKLSVQFIRSRAPASTSISCGPFKRRKEIVPLVEGWKFKVSRCILKQVPRVDTYLPCYLYSTTAIMSTRQRSGDCILTTCAGYHQSPKRRD